MIKEQIEEMQQDLMLAIKWSEGEMVIECGTTAQRLYDAGYRKQIVAEWNEDGRCSNCDFYMPFDCEGNAFETLYCPTCGAKMKGGAE